MATPLPLLVSYSLLPHLQNSIGRKLLIGRDKSIRKRVEDVDPETIPINSSELRPVDSLGDRVGRDLNKMQQRYQQQATKFHLQSKA
ncbi:hypothetical protein MRB53_005253 [Persea americana]|uniref:Uncharacterized protein n=1 Tax=Persea americana TaxID=3435 RepID=A0ACC2MDJ4_PERAE|nr:hypothetical protein MRB53_005253 [Persea americana]